MSDLEKTVHYTTKSDIIFRNLVDYIPKGMSFIEPFVGGGDLLNLFPDEKWEKYDIEDKGNNIIRDTLKNPPDYHDKWVITNPPYLAKNKASDKEIYNKYNVDDLYKAALVSILDCAGGLIIIPTNFFTDERTGKVRTQFLNQFKILEMNVFTEPVFETTTYSVCSFAFCRKDYSACEQEFVVNILPKGESNKIVISPKYDYRIAGEFYNDIESSKNIFGRLVGSESKDYITNIKLYALDTRVERIRVEYELEHYCGKQTDRVYATLTCKFKLTEEQEHFLINEFNRQLEDFRKKYFDLSMTNYRDFNRKRIGFTFVYKLMSKIYFENYRQ